jgi:hypothetical protein
MESKAKERSSWNLLKMLPMGLQGIDGCVFSHNSRAKPFNLF